MTKTLKNSTKNLKNSTSKIEPTFDTQGIETDNLPSPLLNTGTTGTDLTIIPQIELSDILDGEIILPGQEIPQIEMISDEPTGETTDTPSDDTTTDTPTMTGETISSSMGDLMILTMDPKSRLSGSHPTIKKHPKWMINPLFNGRERWMDLSKEYGWNLERKEIILKRSGINHRGMEGFTTRPYNPETDTDFTIRG
jgi:hypothetical protein